MGASMTFWRTVKCGTDELLEDETDAAPDGFEQARVGARAGGRAEEMVADANLAALEEFEAVDAAQEGALAAARGSDDGVDFAFADLKRDALEDVAGAVTLDQAGDGDHSCCSSPSRRSTWRATSDMG